MNKWQIALKILDFLSHHGKAENTPSKWAELIGFEIIDADGWTRETFSKPCTLQAFIDRVSHATIGPERPKVQWLDKANREALADLIGEPFPLP